MWDTFLILDCWLGRPNVHRSVDSDGIKRQDFAVDHLGKFDGDGAFARRGWPRQYNRVVNQRRKALALCLRNGNLITLHIVRLSALVVVQVGLFATS